MMITQKSTETSAKYLMIALHLFVQDYLRI